LLESNNDIIRLAGYDNNGTVYDAGELIIRQVNPEYLNEAQAIFNLYRKLDLKQYGIVETDFVESDGLFRHKKHAISYPFEWTANMFKDAILFHLNLFLELEKHGLTLKDALPSNIVFNFSKPVFVDFLSIVRKDKLQNESWLVEGTNYSDSRFAVFDRMSIPFMLIPLMAMAKNDYSLARIMLSERACNCGGTEPQWYDLCQSSAMKSVKKLFRNLAKRALGRDAKLDINYNRVASIRKLISIKERLSFVDFNRKMLEFVVNTEVTPPKSAYISYYEDKNEAFDIANRSSWENKQKNVYAIISETKPKQVLDLGANTGWFSILAEKLGAEVISTDIDESSIDSLYLYAKKNRLNILPLMIPFDDLTRSIYGVSYSDSNYKDRDFKSNPLFMPATERLKSEVVLCLGLIHHLVLGEGKELESIFEILSNLTRGTLVLEYVSLEDELIQAEPTFFRNLGNYSRENYNVDLLIEIGKRYFASVQILDSHPNTRKLLVFSK
jgi:SAM-dependent methyltransferase